MNSVPLIPSNGELTPASRGQFDPEGLRVLAASQDSALREYLRFAIKHRWLIIASWAIVFAVITIATLRSTPIYDAVGSIAINKTDQSIFDLKDLSSDDMGDSTDVDTEVRVLRSDILALEVINTLNLKMLPEFGGSGLPSPGSLGLTTDELQPNSPESARLLAAFRGRLTVLLVPGTRVIEIHFRSADKNLAAQVVNTLMDTYVEDNFKTKYENTMQASDWLSKQLTEMQIKVETSQEKLVKYQKEHDILGIDEKQNIITSKLAELNQEVTAAEGQRMEKEAVYQLLQSQDPDTAMAAAVSSDRTASPTSGVSDLLQKLQEQYAELKIQAAQLTTHFGPAYPKVAELNNQLKEVQTQIHLEMRQVVGRARGEYLAAVNQEQLLKNALEEQKSEANQLNESSIQYSLLKRDVDTNRTLYEGILERLKEAGVSAGLKSTNFRIVDRAGVPSVPAEPNVPRRLAFGMALGLATGIGLAFLSEGLDNTVRTPDQAQLISALPSLGMIPLGSTTGVALSTRPRLSLASSGEKEIVELVTHSRPQSQMAEAYRALRTSLLLTKLGAPPKVIVITSALPQEGKTTTSLNCAIVLAQKGSRVLLIDADLRRPSIHKVFGMALKSGLSNVLTGNATLSQAVTSSPLVPGLFVLPSGTPPPNPAELLASTNMKEILTELREHYDHIVVDTPPALSVTDAVIMSTWADAVVLVIRSGQTTKHALRRSRDALMMVNAPVAGVLLNAADLQSPDYYYYYEYQSKYGSRYYQQDDGGSEEGNLQERAEALSDDEPPSQSTTGSA